MTTIHFGDLPTTNTLAIRPAPVSSGKMWRIRRAETKLPHENGGLHHVFVRCFRNGERVTEVPIRFFWQGGEDRKGHTEGKPLNEWGDWNAPLYNDWIPEQGPGTYGVEVADGTPSESFVGFGLPRKQHYTYIVEFEEVSAITPVTIGEQLRLLDRAHRISLHGFEPCTAALVRDGFAPGSEVFQFEHGGKSYKGQCAVRLSDGTQRSYYHPEHQPADVRFL